MTTTIANLSMLVALLVVIFFDALVLLILVFSHLPSPHNYHNNVLSMRYKRIVSFREGENPYWR